MLSKVLEKIGYLRAAWILFLIAIPLRLYFYGGYACLGDDINDLYLSQRIVSEGRLDPLTAQHYRLMTVLPRALAFLIFGVNPYSFILPIFLFALAVYAATLGYARTLLGDKGAFLVSLFFLTTPFETLSATLNVNDYITAFFAVLAVWQLHHGYYFVQAKNMRFAALAVVGGVLNKVSGIGIIPVIGISCLASYRHWRRWVPFWVALLVLLSCVCIADFFYSGHFLRWYYFNNFFNGYDVTNLLWLNWSRFPRYLFWKDGYGHFMFGVTAWLSLLGAIVSLWMQLTKRSTPASTFVFLGWFVFFNLIEFMPHQLTLKGYFSHPRVFRYLANIVPLVHVGAAFFILVLFEKVKGKFAKRLVELCCVAVILFNLYETPIVTKPAWDSGRDGEKLISFLNSSIPKPSTAIYASHFKCDWLWVIWKGEDIYQYKLDCFDNYPQDLAGRQNFLSGIKEGTVITGGSMLAWYGIMDQVPNLSEAKFEPPSNWQLLYEYKASKELWRRENLRVWKVTPE